MFEPIFGPIFGKPWHTLTATLAPMQIGSSDEVAAQLVVEVIVRDLATSLAFYEALGFRVDRRDDDFAVLRWDQNRLFLDEKRDLPTLEGRSRANIRVIVPAVDIVWDRVQALGIPVERPIANRAYGLRAFTILDPDGFGLRFAQWLQADV